MDVLLHMALNQGALAYVLGKTLNDNPYLPEEPEWKMWKRGYMRAWGRDPLAPEAHSEEGVVTQD